MIVSYHFPGDNHRQSIKHVFLLCQHYIAQILLVHFLGKLSVLKVVLKTVNDKLASTDEVLCALPFAGYCEAVNVN